MVSFTAYLGLGSNLGDRRDVLKAAATRLAARDGVAVRASSLHETEPVDYLDQPWFLNAVLELKFKFPVDPHRLLVECLALEAEFGRVRTVPKGARTLDIDMLLWLENGTVVVRDEVRDGAALVLPHPRLHVRRFVLEPLCELCPDAIHPKFGKSFRILLVELSDKAVVRSLGPFPF